jgi:hypothetical protein
MKTATKTTATLASFPNPGRPGSFLSVDANVGLAEAVADYMATAKQALAEDCLDGVETALRLAAIRVSRARLQRRALSPSEAA